MIRKRNFYLELIFCIRNSKGLLREEGFDLDISLDLEVYVLGIFYIVFIFISEENEEIRMKIFN